MTDHVDPTREQFDAFKDLPRDKPVEMINLLRLYARANYPDGHPQSGEEMTGAEAYRHYGEKSGPVFTRVGGRIIWSGRPMLMLIGPADETWDTAFVAQYPSAGAFMEMVTDPIYRQAVIHRQAAVRTSRLIRCSPHAPATGFA